MVGREDLGKRGWERKYKLEDKEGKGQKRERKWRGNYWEMENGYLKRDSKREFGGLKRRRWEKMRNTERGKKR